MKEYSDKDLLKKPMIDDKLFKNGISCQPERLNPEDVRNNVCDSLNPENK